MPNDTPRPPGIAPSVTPEDVAEAYRWILGRSVESEEVARAHAAAARSPADLRRRLLTSEEFRAKQPDAAPAVPFVPLLAPPIEVETEAGPEQLAAAIAAVGRYWGTVGEEAPHWSVLTNDAFRPDRIGQTEAQFYATGEADLRLVQAVLARVGADAAAIRRVCEYGCGTGRATWQLARGFPEVVGLDISAAHLRVAAEWLARQGIGNVTLRQVTPAALHPAEGYDLWFSRIVLQHNPPPVMLAILRAAFRGLSPGGIALFQVPTYAVGYRFRLAEYLSHKAGRRMEMHVVPQRAVLRLAAEEGLELLELREDTRFVVSRAERWVSNLFCLRRPPA